MRQGQITGLDSALEAEANFGTGLTEIQVLRSSVVLGIGR